MGILFEFDPETNILTKKIDFSGTENGSHPNGSLLEATNGKLYGMTLDGGVYNMGVIFEWDPVTGVYIKMLDFDGAECGKYPYGSLMQADNGYVYGMCSEGGTNNAGVLFNVDTEDHSFLKKIDFSGPEMGMNPYGSLLQAANGKMFGMTRRGGKQNEGVIFEFDPVSSVLQKRIDFSFRSKGRYPYGSLIQGDNGKLYGMTWGGGNWGFDSAHPPGPEGKGVLFEWDPVSNAYAVKVDFGYDGNSLSQCPFGSLVKSGDGRIFGMTSTTIFEWEPPTNIIRHNIAFKESGNSSQKGSLLVLSGGKILGIYSNGGPNEFGIMFEINPKNNTCADKVVFNGKGNGSCENFTSEANSLVQSKSGKVYGITSLGGINNSGVLFEWDPVTGNFEKKMDFGGMETGKNPCGGLLQANNGKLYGMTAYGGRNGYGTLFEWDPEADTFKSMLDFEGSTLTRPTGSLIQGENGLFYGCRKASLNSLDKAILFEWDLQSGIYKEKLVLGPMFPYGQGISSPVEAGNGKLYFTYKSLYEWDPVTDSLVLKHEFTPVEGYYPVNSIKKSSNGKLIGRTINGGLYGHGTFYEYDITNDFFKRLYGFTSSGGYPTSDLVEYVNPLCENLIVCDSMVSPSGRFTYKQDGIYHDTIPGINGDKEVVTVILKVNHSTALSIYASTCGNYKSPDGQYTWTQTGIYRDTIPNASGCDSIITVHLTVNKPSFRTITANSCGSYVSPDGNHIWPQTGVYKDTIPNASGCDSIITVNLTVSHNTFSSMDTTGCYSYNSPSGMHTWKETGDYMDTIPNSEGCDSIISIHLTIKRINTNVVENQWGLRAAFSGGKYSWLNCENNTLLNGHSEQSLMTNIPGSYAVIISDGGCADTSVCYTILPTGIKDDPFNNAELYPNPTSGSFTINLGEVLKDVRIMISAPDGRKVYIENFRNTKTITLDPDIPPGTYLINVFKGNNSRVFKLIKNDPNITGK